MDSWWKHSFVLGSFAGAVVGAAGAAEMLAANELTINPLSSLFVLGLWMLFGAAAGGAVGLLGGRFSMILKQPCTEGALAMAVLLSGHLFLPTGFGLGMGVIAVLASRVRRHWFPRSRRLDGAIAVGLAVAACIAPRDFGAPPPREGLDAPLAAGTPMPGSFPVTISVRTEPGFPQVPAMHLPVRPLASEEPGIRAALWTGRLPDRTRVGRGWPRSLPGGGAIHRPLPWPGAHWLVSLFPRFADPAGTPCEPVGQLAAIAEASGIPVLRHPPRAGDPPHFLRILEGTDAPDEDLARALRAEGAWIDVVLDGDGGTLAIAGDAFLLAPSDGLVNLVDVAPTALHLLGLPIPRPCDGRVLNELMASPGPAARPLRYAALFAPVSESTTSR